MNSFSNFHKIPVSILNHDINAEDICFSVWCYEVEPVIVYLSLMKPDKKQNKYVVCLLLKWVPDVMIYQTEKSNCSPDIYLFYLICAKSINWPDIK